MRLLITVLFLGTFGSVSMADVGDVYYCEVESIITSYFTADNREFLDVTDRSPKRFKFKWDKDKNGGFIKVDDKGIDVLGSGQVYRIDFAQTKEKGEVLFTAYSPSPFGAEMLRQLEQKA